MGSTPPMSTVSLETAPDQLKNGSSVSPPRAKWKETPGRTMTNPPQPERGPPLLCKEKAATSTAVRLQAPLGQAAEPLPWQARTSLPQVPGEDRMDTKPNGIIQGPVGQNRMTVPLLPPLPSSHAPCPAERWWCTISMPAEFVARARLASPSSRSDPHACF